MDRGMPERSIDGPATASPAVGQSLSRGSPGPDPASALRGELAAVCSNLRFARSPIMTRLLTYLVGETLAGRGDKLKSYAVAVDGLGRGSEFDALSDSYPRVQVARLRRALDAHYGQVPTSRPRLSIPRGSYRVDLLRPSDQALLGAEPVNEPPAPMAPPQDQSASPLIEPPPSSPQPPSRRAFSVPVPALIVFTIVAIGVLAWLSLRHDQRVPTPPRSAIVVVGAPISPGDADAVDDAREIRSKLLDGLSRSWALRPAEAADAAETHDSGRVYRIETQLARPAGSTRSLFVRLYDNASSTLVWSREFSVPDKDADMGQATDLVLASLGGSYGVIAEQEARRLHADWSPGYACILKFMQFVTTRDHGFAQKLQHCTAQPSPEPRLEGMRLSVGALLALDGPASRSARPALLRGAREKAAQAADSYPQDYYTHYALARISYATGNCEQGARHSAHAMELSPNDPAVTGMLAMASYFCGRPDPTLAERAFHLQLNADNSTRLSSILLAIATGRRDWLQILADLPVHRAGTNMPFVHLCNTLLHAALDQTAEARESWHAFRSALDPGRTEDALLAEFIVSDATRNKVSEFLRKKGVTGRAG